MPADRNQNRRKLQELLRELFQFDTADLDFGIYKILHHRKQEIERFIEADLLAAVNAALQSYQAGEQTGLEQQLTQEAEKVRTNLGANAIDNKGIVHPLFAATPMVQGYLELQEKIASTEVAAETEAAIYNDLYTFFSRYYDNGDFLSKRRYSSRDPKYFIPYNGEEVMLHWANRDQYYVKSGEHFTDYRFKLEGTNQGQQVHFQLDRADVPQDNVKASTDREFVLRTENPVLWDGGTNELTVFFEYRPLTDAETANYLDRYNSLQAKSKQRKTLDRAARCVAMEQVILAALSDNLPVRDALAAPHKGEAEKSLLNYHLNQYTARNTSDYFVHKDLGGFLRGQLDFYLKNEVLDIDALIGDGRVESLQHALRRATVVRSIAEKVIAFLAQIENFQKRLFEKKKFVVETNYCMTLDRIPESFYPEIAANDAQREEWIRLYAIDEIEASDDSPAYSEPLTVEFLRANPYLMMDTCFFGEEFKIDVISTMESLDEQCDGLLIHSENFQALHLLSEPYRGQVDSIYIDPPYNATATEIIYKNEYKHSSWLTLACNRISASIALMKDTCLLCATIDDYELNRLRLALDNIFQPDNYLATVPIRNNPSGRSTVKGFAINHEYALFYAKFSSQATVGRLPHSEKQISRYDQLDDEGRKYEWENFRKNSTASNREDRPKQFYPLYFDAVSGSIRLPALEWQDAEKAWLVLNEPSADEVVILPIQENVEKVWRYGVDRAMSNTQELMVQERNGIFEVYKRKYIKEEGSLPRTWWDNAAYSARDNGTRALVELFGPSKGFDFPKSVYAVMDCLRVCSSWDKALILDYFGGSGTTGHAVINLNREDDGERKYILVEMGDYFDSVTKPRIQKVVYSTDWRAGKPQTRNTGISHCFKYLRLESYEDALNNVRLQRPATGQDALLPDEAPDYLLSYLLDVESRHSPTLLTQDAFTIPFDYKLRIQRGYVSPEEQSVDLVETFHYLIGLHVKTLRTYQHQERRYRISTGEVHTDKSTQRIAVVWRNSADLDLDAEKVWIAEILDPADFDTIYVNGASHIPKSEPLEITFRTRMETPPHAS